MDKIITGTYRYQIDPKGRVRIPSKLREMLGSELSIGYGAGEYLVIYTEETIRLLKEKYAGVEVYSGDEYDSVREIFANIYPFAPDGQDRFQIPLPMRENVGLRDEIVFVGVLNKLEIWSAENYAHRKDKAISQSKIEDYRALK